MAKMLKILALSVLFTTVLARSVLDEPLDENSIPELNYLNRSVDPCEDFYEYSCGNFDKFNPLPEGKKIWDSYYILQEKLDKITVDILSSDKKTDDPSAIKKVKDLYAACMKTSYSNYYSVQPLAKVVEELGDWPLISNSTKHYPNNKFSWTKTADIISKYGLPFFINWQIVPSMNDANEYMIIILKDSLALPTSIIMDREENPDDIFEDIFRETEMRKENPYVKYVNKIATTLTEHMHTYPSSVYADIEEVLKFMIKISQSPNYPRHVDFAGTITNIDELQKWSDSFSKHYNTRIHWLQFFKRSFNRTGAKINKHTKVYVSNQDSLANILDAVENTKPVILKNFILTRLTTYMAPDSDMVMWEAYNQLYRDTYGDKYPIFERPEYCRRKVMNSQMMMAVAFEYGSYYFDYKKILNAQEMIQDLRESFLEILEEKEWLDDAAKQSAKEKLEKMITLIGFPEFLFEENELDNYFSNIKVCRHNHFYNMQSLRVFNFAKAVTVLGKPRDRRIWNNSPLNVNAFYNPQNNRIVFPAAIMNPPFYAGQLSVLDYGRIGAIIGHEITHGFDNKGMMSDGDGNFEGIWPPSIKNIFDEKADCFNKQYSKYYIREIDEYVNGTVTLAENIADNGGIREAYKAYLKISSRRKQPAVEDFSKEQMFFIAFGTNWCRTDTKESLVTMHQKDNHSPNRFRVHGCVSNMKEFSEAFNCPLGSKMNPSDKCLLW